MLLKKLEILMVTSFNILILLGNFYKQRYLYESEKEMIEREKSRGKDLKTVVKPKLRVPAQCVRHQTVIFVNKLLVELNMINCQETFLKQLKALLIVNKF